MHRARFLAFASVATMAALGLAAAPPAAAQTTAVSPGPNVNMVSGTQWPGGDPFLQRQNEPSIAVSTRNPLHLLAGANDYRTVDLPGLPEGRETGDAWLGVFRSVDGGGSWKSTLVRGYPQDSGGASSPLAGYEAAADPVVRAGTHGLFYYSGIVFDRSLQRSAAFVARFMDLNNETVEPVRYIDTVLVDSIGDGSAFIDKPWLEVDVPRAGAQTVALSVPQGSGTVGQTVACGNVYMAWAEITGQGPALRTRIMFSRSANCGGSWSDPVALSPSDATGRGLTVGQGATIAVAPATGRVYVAWRQFRNATADCVREKGFWKNTPNAWPVGSLVVGGVTYTKDGALLVLKKTYLPSDAPGILAQQLIPAKLNVLSGADQDPVRQTIIDADAWLVKYPLGSKPSPSQKQAGLALKDTLEAYNLGLAGCPTCTAGTTVFPDAVLVTSSDDGGASFSAPQEVAKVSPFDQGTSEYSFRTNAYPTMAVDETGRAYLAWATRGLATPNSDSLAGDARIVVTTSRDGGIWTTSKPIDQPAKPGHQLFPSLTYSAGQLMLVYNDYRADASGVFERFVVDLLDASHPRRHTVDMRAAVASPADVPSFTNYSLLKPSSQVSRYPSIVTGTGEGDAQGLQLQYNPPNLPMFELGHKPFFGDYHDVAGAPRFVTNPDGSWRYNTAASTAPVFHAAWTDNRDVVGPPDGDWASYVPPGEAHTSLFDGTTQVPGCEATPGAVDRTQMRNQNIYTSRLTSGLFVAVPSNSRPLSNEFQRAFVVFVQNATDTTRSFQLEIQSSAQGVTASFQQFSMAPTWDVTIGAYSSISQTVFVESSDPAASIDVRVRELSPCSDTNTCLESTVRINPDPSNPPPADDTLQAGEIYNPAVLNPAVLNPAVLNPAVLNPAVLNPAVLNPAVLNYDVGNPAVYNPAVLNPAVYNPAVLEAFNLMMMSLAFLNPAVYNPAVLNPAVLNPAVLNPAVLNPAVLNPAVLNPAVYNPAVLNPAVLNPAVLNPAVYNQSLTDRSATEANYVVQNAGNATMAYSFNLRLANPQPGLAYQLMIYRLYFIPVANGCELAEAAQQELLVNDLAPNLNANLLDPNGGDSFFLNPGDVAIATLRVVPDPEAQPPGDPSTFRVEDLSASVVAKGGNTDDVADGDTQPPFAPILAPTVPPLVITTSALPSAVVGAFYSTTLTATGGSGPRTWTLAPGSTLPANLALSTSGAITGTPESTGSFTVTIRVADATQLVERTFTSVIAPVAGGLAFLTQPADNTPVDSSLGTVRVSLTDTSGAAVPGVTVTVTLVPNGNTGTLVPPTSMLSTDLTGVATFSGLQVTTAGSGYRLLATAGNLAALSNPFDISSGAVPLHFAYQGTVDRTDGYDSGGVPNPAPYAAFMGQTIRVEYTFDPAAADSNASANGDYVGAIEALTVTVGSSVYTATSGNIIIINSPPQPDQYIVDVPTGLSGPPVGGVPVGRIEIILTDPSYAYFATDALPTTPPSPSGFSQRAIQLQFWDNSVPYPIGPYGIIQANNVASATSSGSPWIRQFGTAGDEHALGVATDGSGVYVAGETYGTLPGQASAGSADAFVRKYDLAGDELWTRQFGTAGNDFAQGVAVYASAVYVVGGASSALPGQSSAGSTDAFVRKYDLDGNEVWTRQFGTAGFDLGAGIFVNASGVYVAGQAEGTLPGQSSSGVPDAFLRKYDLDGNEAWTRQFGGVDIDEAFAVTGDASSVYVAGWTGVLPGQTSSGAEDAFVRKYDLGGNEVWTRQFGSVGDDVVFGVSTDASGVYLAGETGSTLPGQTSAGVSDAFVRRYDVDGNEVWTRQFGTAGFDFGAGIFVNASGVYVAGQAGGTLPGQTSAGVSDAFVRKYDPSGNEIWTSQFGSAGGEKASGTSVDATGLYVTGRTSGTLPGQASAGSADAFVIRLVEW